MRVTYLRNWLSAAPIALVIASFVASPQATAQTELRFVSNWGKNLYSVKRTIEWAEKFNRSAAAKAAKIRIKYIGGREVTPPLQQLSALRKGVFDMLFGAVVGWLFLGYNARYARPSFQGERQFASLSACLSFSLRAVSN